MSTTHTFTGQVTMYSSVASFPGPKVVEATCTLELADDQATVGLRDFETPVLEDVNAGQSGLGLLSLTIALDEGASGKFSQTDGSMAINCVVIFQFKTIFKIPVGNTNVALRLVTGSAKLPTVGTKDGMPAATDGTVVLVGAGDFEGDLDAMEGKRCGVVLKGVFDPPLPR